MGNHNSTPTCPVSDTSGPEIQPLVGNLTWHSLSIIIGGVAAAVAILIAVFLIFKHACHFSNPAEQKQIIRVITIVPSFAIISFLCVWLDGAAPYISPGREVGEALPMAAFLLLMSTYVAPDERNRDTFFDQMALLDKKGTAQGRGSLQWYRRLAFGVLQWIPVSIVLWIATAISLAVGTYCIPSNNIHFAHIWITIIRTISTTLAIVSILRFYRRSKSVLKPRGALKQLVCFKILVFLDFLQTLIFSILVSSGDLHASKYFTFNDLAYGLPSLILCCEMALVAPYFLVAYSAKPYILGSISSPENPSSRHDIQHYQGGPIGFYAILQAINIVDIVIEMVKAASAKVSGRSSQLGNQHLQSQPAPGHVASGKRDFMNRGYAAPNSGTRLEPYR